MATVSILRRLTACACLTALAWLWPTARVEAAEDAEAQTPARLVNMLAQSMVARHPKALTLGKVDTGQLIFEVTLGQDPDAKTLLLFLNRAAADINNNDFFDHFEYRGYEFELRGSNNLAALGAGDGLIQALDNMVNRLKTEKIEPEHLKGRVNLLIAGVLVFQFKLDQADAKPQFWIDGTRYDASFSAWYSKEEVKAKQDDFHQAAQALEKKIDGDQALPFAVRKALVRFIEISHEVDESKIEDAKSKDQLSDAFARLVLNDQYLETALGKKAADFKKEMDTYRFACAKVMAYKPRILLTAADKSELTEYQNPWGNKLWVKFDGPTGETHLIVRHHESDQFKVYMHRIFAKADPKNLEAILKRSDWDRLALSFPFYGTLATYDGAAKKFECDTEKWDNAAKAFFSPRMGKHFLPPHRMFPPHIPIYRFDGQVEGLAVPKGLILPPDFAAVPEAKRADAHKAFLAELADKLPDVGYLHLLFQNLTQYVFDSPDPKLAGVIGNSVQKSDLHQTADQILDSRLAGRYLGDCDDIAEFYAEITRLQNRQSFVMGVPGHATCGFVTRNEDGSYVLNFLDTGPARELSGKDLDKLIETGVRTYDQENRMHFSPDQVEFLFRFAGEKTRTAYVLSTRMFVDPQYAKDMIEVQSYWHFHTYNLGIVTMEKMLADGDRISANYFEVSSLYSQCRLWENAFKRQQEGIASIKEDDRLTNLSARIRLATWQNQAHMNDEAAKTLAALNQSLDEVPREELQRVLEFIMETGSVWKQIKQPYDGYAPLDRIMTLTGGNLLHPLAPGLVNLYEGMVEYNKTNKPTEEQDKTFKKVEMILKRFYGNNQMMFNQAEDIDDEMRRFASLGQYYRARMGAEAFQKKLLEEGPAPAKGVKPSDNRDPRDPETDWMYIRSSFFVYMNEVGQALDDDNGTKTPDVEAALKWAKLAIASFDRQQEFTQSSTGDLAVLGLKANIALLTKDWPALSQIYDDASDKDYARHTLSLSDSLGRLAKFLKPDEFRKAIELWDKHIGTKQYYYMIAYAALEAEAYEACAIATDLICKRFPKDKTMVDEAAALRQAIPVAKKWYEDRAVANKLAAEEAQKKAEAEKKKAAAAKQEPDAEVQPEAQPLEATP